MIENFKNLGKSIKMHATVLYNVSLSNQTTMDVYLYMVKNIRLQLKIALATNAINEA